MKVGRFYVGGDSADGAVGAPSGAGTGGTPGASDPGAGGGGGGGVGDGPSGDSAYANLVQQVLTTGPTETVARDYGFGDGGPQTTATPITTATTATPGGIYNFNPAAYQPVRYAPQYDQFGQGIASLFGSDYSRLFGPRGAMPPAPAPGGGGGGGPIPGGGGGGGGGGYTPIAPPPPGFNPPAPAPAPNPYTVTPSMSPAQIASIYNNYVMANGGADTQATRDAAARYLQSVGLTQAQIDAAYSYYLGNYGIPRPAPTAAPVPAPAPGPAPAPAPAPNPYAVTPSMDPSEVARLYNQFVMASGGQDTQATRDAAAKYLLQSGLTNEQIQAAYRYYLDTYISPPVDWDRP